MGIKVGHTNAFLKTRILGKPMEPIQGVSPSNPAKALVAQLRACYEAAACCRGDAGAIRDNVGAWLCKCLRRGSPFIVGGLSGIERPSISRRIARAMVYMFEFPAIAFSDGPFACFQIDRGL